MPSFLDADRLDFSLPATQELVGILADRYYSEDRIVELLRKTPLGPGQVNLQGPARRIWFHVLETAFNKNLVHQVVTAASEDERIGQRIGELLEAEVVEIPYAPAGKAGEPAVKRWAGPDQVGGIERLLDDVPTWFDVAFLAKGSALAPAVGRFIVRFGRKTGYATGFRIGKDLLLTNHHVLHNWEDGDRPLDEARIWFDYELGIDGKPKKTVQIELDPATVVGDKQHDWGVIRAQEALPERFPIIPLGKPAMTASADRVFIIQHPRGDLKKIGMVRNMVSHVDDDVIQYLTDTDQGSSGSPVFNEFWQLVAIHHYWVEVAGQKDGEKVAAYRNQGRRIERVKEGLEAAGIQLQ